MAALGHVAKRYPAKPPQPNRKQATTRIYLCRSCDSTPRVHVASRYRLSYLGYPWIKTWLPLIKLGRVLRHEIVRSRSTYDMTSRSNYFCFP